MTAFVSQDSFYVRAVGTGLIVFQNSIQVRVNAEDEAPPAALGQGGGVQDHHWVTFKRESL